MKVKRKNIPWQMIGHQVVIVDSKQNQAHELSEVGSEIWKNLEEPITDDQLILRLCEIFEVEENTASADLKEFLDQLEEHKLIETEL